MTARPDRKATLPILNPAARLPEELQGSLVEVLFDYQPEKWFHPDFIQVPPPREQLSDTGRSQLRKVGQSALQKVKLRPEQRQAVEDTLRALDRSTSRPGGS